MCDSLAALLTSLGYQVATYSSCLEFLSASPKTMPDGIVLDHQMDGMTGVELLEHLAAKGDQPPIIMISGNLSDAVRERAQRAGVAKILDKPFSESDLIASLKKVIA